MILESRPSSPSAASSVHLNCTIIVPGTNFTILYIFFIATRSTISLNINRKVRDSDGDRQRGRREKIRQDLYDRPFSIFFHIATKSRISLNKNRKVRVDQRRTKRKERENKKGPVRQIIVHILHSRQILSADQSQHGPAPARVRRPSTNQI